MKNKARINYWVDIGIGAAFLLAALSGIVLLAAGPSGGYQGGRNALYGLQILFNRDTWDDLHTWGGVIMIGVVALHVAIHWDWIVMMAKRMISVLWSKGSQMSKGAKINLLVDFFIAVSFFLTAVSGIYFLFAPTGGFQGGQNAGWDPGFLFSRTTWDLIHTWAGVVLIGAAAVHFVIHWRWIKNVTTRFFKNHGGLPKGQAISSVN